MIRHRTVRPGLCALAAATIALTGTLVSNSPAEPRLESIRQPLVGGTTVDEDRQEEFGLLDLNGSCSASLLRNNWVITAAHCLEVDGPDGKPMPDPRKPGQNVVQSPGSVLLLANWKNVQQQPAVEIVTFRPYDVAIIRVAAPFTVRGSTTGYSRLVFQDGQFPYFGHPVGVPIMAFGRGIYQFASGTGDTAMAALSDGQFRVGYFKTTSLKDTLYWYPSVRGQMGAGGDSGGPSFAWVLGGWALVGVHSTARAQYVPGKPKDWTWATATTEMSDAPIAPVLKEISRIMGPAPPSEPSTDSPPPGFIGTFSQTPKNYQPMWVYAIRPNGVLVWYRKDSGDAPWQGPKDVGYGWGGFKDVIPAGGNAFYVLTADNKLNWYQHDGFNDGSFNWKGPVEVGNEWNVSRIFSGGEGIVYAIRANGDLMWLRNKDRTNFGIRSWEGSWEAAKVVGSTWGQFKEVFSTGQGNIYAVKHDGTLLHYQHTGYATGTPTWKKERIVGSAWNQFQQIVPVGDGVMLAVRPDGALIWYKHLGLVSTPQGRLTDVWEKEVTIGSGWQDFSKVIALIPVATPQGPR